MMKLRISIFPEPTEQTEPSMLIVVAAAGFLAGQVMKGGGYDHVGDVLMGIVGAFVGGFVANLLGLAGAFGSIVGQLILHACTTPGL